jgi:hypothetical protein
MKIVDRIFAVVVGFPEGALRPGFEPENRKTATLLSSVVGGEMSCRVRVLFAEDNRSTATSPE